MVRTHTLCPGHMEVQAGSWQGFQVWKSGQSICHEQYLCFHFFVCSRPVHCPATSGLSPPVACLFSSEWHSPHTHTHAHTCAHVHVCTHTHIHVYVHTVLHRHMPPTANMTPSGRALDQPLSNRVVCSCC